MEWMFSAATATLIGAAVLSFVYLYLAGQERNKALTIWSFAWLVYMCRFVFLLLWLQSNRDTLAWVVARDLCAMISAALMLWGTLAWTGRPLHWLWPAGAAVFAAWTAGARTGGVEELWVLVPTFAFMGLVFVWTGAVFLRLPDVDAVGKYVVGGALILWGVHKWDFPFVWTHPHWAPTGYFIAALLSLVTAMGMLLLYFERGRRTLRENETRFRELTEHIPEVFWMGSADGEHIYYVSPAYETVWGRTTRSLYDDPRSWLNTVVEEDRPAVRATMAMIQKKAPPQGASSRYRIARPDGALRWIASRVFPVLDAGGRVYRVAGVAEDITDRVRAEADNQALQTQVQHAQKLESLGVLAGGIAHDFNNLLVSMLGNADLTLMELSPVSPARPNVEDIKTAAMRAADLTNQMLAYSGKGRFVVKAFDLNELIRETTALLEVSISKKAVLKYRLCESACPMKGDVVQARQVLMNLVTNASEAIAETSGVITLATGTMNAEADYLAETYLDDDLPAGHYVFLEVSDTGAGMDGETKAKLFDPFFTTKFTGRGLGLAAVLGIIRGHRGAIKVYSEPGRGTTFRVLFPRNDQTLAAPIDEAAEPSGDYRGQGVLLLVDDEESVRTVGRAMLEKHGFTVVTAVDGEEGGEQFAAQPDEIAAVLLDVTMPRVDGEEAFRRMRQIRPDVRVILCSGYNEQEATSRFAGKGLAGFLQKPFSMGALIAKVRDVLEGRG